METTPERTWPALAAPADGRDPAERRIVVMLTHALHTTTALFLVLALVRAWQADEHPVASTVVVAAMVLAYLLAHRLPALLVLIGLWAYGSTLSMGFSWVAFPLFFLVIHLLPWRAHLPLVAVMAAWAAWATGSVLGPSIGALAAVLASVLFGQQRLDAQRNRALVAELRAAQETLADTERARGVLAERERLAREIHDTVGQGLASIVMLSRTARQGQPGALDLIESTARDNLAEVRRLIRDLGSRPGEVGLEDGLAALAEDFRARSRASGRPLDVELATDGVPRPLDPAVVAALHRGVQATLANVLQHADATRCRIGLGWFDDHAVVDVVDDGQGFDPASVGGDSYGLRALRERMAGVGGSVDVDTAPGEGTTVALTVPVVDRDASTTTERQEQR